MDDFLETVERIDEGGSVVEPGLVQQLVAARCVRDPLDELTMWHDAPERLEKYQAIDPALLRTETPAFAGVSWS